MEIFYGLLRMQELSSEDFSGKDFLKAEFLLSCLLDNEDYDFSRFKNFFSEEITDQRLASLLSYLERLQSLSLRDEENRSHLGRALPDLHFPTFVPLGNDCILLSKWCE